MFVAVDGNGRPVSIEDTNDRDKYHCPDCNQELITKKGNKRLHHFAHKKGSVECTDIWRTTGLYDKPNKWHRDWEMLFPIENREVQLTFGAIKHRGDIVVGNTVLELQHSSITSKPFDERTKYYHSCDCKVIWLFDFIETVKNGELKTEDDNIYVWNSFKRTFRYIDEITGQVEFFFQIKDGNDGSKCIICVDVNKFQEKSNHFVATSYYTKEEFLDYIGRRKDGSFAPPNLLKIDQDPLYQSFKEEYNINLDPQQERALQHFDGATLLTAVPGSGKTTTLVARLGYMTTRKNIDPSTILAITYTNAAVDKMKEDFRNIFGDDIGNRITFKTIHKVCTEIIRYVGIEFSTIINTDRKSLLKSLYRFVNHDYSTEADLVNMESEISYIKNMMIPEKEIEAHCWSIPNIAKIYQEYCESLKNQKQIDFDDQLSIAFKILRDDITVKSVFQNKYQHICVDEAQDTSKIQHEIIRLLVGKNNNIFMVGDEDQSIYGYRGAYPQALFEFDHVYLNPFHLSLETNYRSNKEIVEVANKIIERNPGRRPKNMFSFRGNGGIVNYAEVENRSQQVDFLVKKSKEEHGDMAVIYRNNETAVAIIDAFERNDIPYYLNKATELFFTNRVLNDILTFFRFSLDSENRELFMNCYFNLHMFFKKERAQAACSYSNSKHTILLDEFIEQNKYLKGYKQSQIQEMILRAEKFKSIITSLPNHTPAVAIESILENGYLEYADEKQIDCGALGTILNIAGNTGTITEFLDRIDELGKIVQEKLKNKEKSDGDIILSTIHSCKGMEFDEVIIVDAIDGILPSRKALYLTNDERFGYYAEEVRLFYVAVTRAKNTLTIIKIDDEDQSFVDILLGTNIDYECIYRTKKKEKQPSQEKLVNDDITYSVRYMEKQSWTELIPPKSITAHIGDMIIEKAPELSGYVCKSNVVERKLNISDRFTPITFEYSRKMLRINFSIDGKQKYNIYPVIIDIDSKATIPVLPDFENEIIDWYLDSDKTISVKTDGRYLELPNVKETDAEITDIYLFGFVLPKPLKTILEIGNEISFRKVLVVENDKGHKERITQNINNMYSKYHRVYGDNGSIADFDKPIWKIVSKL